MLRSILSLFDPDAEENVLRKNILTLSVAALTTHCLTLSPPKFPPTIPQASIYEVLTCYIFTTGLQIISGILGIIIIYLTFLYLFKLSMQLIFFTNEKIKRSISWLEIYKIGQELVFDTNPTANTREEVADEYDQKIAVRVQLVHSIESSLLIMNDSYKILKRFLPAIPGLYTIIVTFPDTLSIIKSTWPF